MNMQYRRLGRSGLQVSVFSLGSWVSFGEQIGIAEATDCLPAAYDAGVNFFDNAESYAGGESERIMGAAIAKLGWARHSYVISTKVFWGLHDLPNMKNTLNRKYLMQAIDGSLERLGLDFVDLLFCHRADSEHADRGDGVGDVRHRRERPRALLGHVGVDGRRDPRRVAHRRQAPPAQAGDGAAAVQPARPRAASSSSTCASTTTSGSVSPPTARSRRVCSPASTSTASPTAAAGRCRATSGCTTR